MAGAKRTRTPSVPPVCDPSCTETWAWVLYSAQPRSVANAAEPSCGISEPDYLPLLRHTTVQALSGPEAQRMERPLLPFRSCGSETTVEEAGVDARSSSQAGASVPRRQTPPFPPNQHCARDNHQRQVLSSRRIVPAGLRERGCAGARERRQAGGTELAGCRIDVLLGWTVMSVVHPARGRTRALSAGTRRSLSRSSRADRAGRGRRGRGA